MNNVEAARKAVKIAVLEFKQFGGSVDFRLIDALIEAVRQDERQKTSELVDAVSNLVAGIPPRVVMPRLKKALKAVRPEGGE